MATPPAIKRLDPISDEARALYRINHDGITDGLQSRSAKIRGWASDSYVAKSVPRFKFTFFADFKINPLANAGNPQMAKTAGYYMAALKSMSVPTITYNVEKIRQYNKDKNIITKTEYPDITVTVYDDSLSHMRGMLAAYRAHYTFGGLMSNVPNPHIDSHDPLTKVSLGQFPSLGLRPVSAPFFDRIVLYDLGSEPAAINIYRMINPIIKEITVGEADYSDNDTPREINITFSYEYLDEEIGGKLDLDEINLPDVYETGVLATRRDREEVFGTSEEPGRWGTFQPQRFNDPLRAQYVVEGFNELLDTLDSQAARNTRPPALLLAIQKSIQGGVVNFEDLQENIFRALARGTAIQNMRVAATKALLVRQAIEQGRFLDVVALLGAGVDSLADGVGKIAETGQSVINTISDVGNTGSWASKHINSGSLTKLGGLFGS